MQRFHHLPVLLLLLGLLASFAAAQSAPTFCKCTCFKNSTLIQLGSSSAAVPEEQKSMRAAASTSSCATCTRAFCLSQGLPICEDAEEGDVLATCFQRDSRKDQIIVWGFILGTTGLLGWAAARRAIALRNDKRAAAAGMLGGGRPGLGGDNSRGAYAPVSGPR